MKPVQPHNNLHEILKPCKAHTNLQDLQRTLLRTQYETSYSLYNPIAIYEREPKQNHGKALQTT